MWSPSRRRRELARHLARLAEADAWLAAARAETREIASWPSPLDVWLSLWQADFTASTVQAARAVARESTAIRERPHMSLAARGLPVVLDPNTGKPVEPLIQRIRDEATRHARSR